MDRDQDLRLGLGLAGSFDILPHATRIHSQFNAACASMKRTDAQQRALDSSLADTSYLLNLIVLVPTDNSKP